MQCTLLNWQVQKWEFLLGFLCRKRDLACSHSGLFNFGLLFALANYLEIVQQIRDFREDCLKFWLFTKKGIISTGIPTTEAKVEIETQLLTSKCSK